MFAVLLVEAYNQLAHPQYFYTPCWYPALRWATGKHGNAGTETGRFLLGTGRMPHPVGGAVGVTWCHCREKGNTRFETVVYFDLDC